ncbi:MAG: TolC family protein [Elusimicrobia bacterium]|nr:TolC family protein [Elusimicrobiota bacterium]
MRLLLILFLAALPPAASAAGIPAEITWRECEETALKNNPDLSAQRNSIEQAKYSYLAGLNSLYPQIGLSHSFSRSGGQGSSPSSRWGAGISASETIFNLKTYSSVRTSRLSFEKAEEDYRDRSAAVRQTLSTAFLNLIYAQANLKAQKRIQDIREQNARLISLKYDSGRESRGNMLYSTALAAQAKSDVARAERSVDSARRDLLNAMGSADYVPLVARGELTLPDDRLDLTGIRAKIERIPQIQSQKKSLETLKERALAAKFDAAPVVSANQGVNWSGDSEFPGRRSWSFGFSLSLPLFSNGPTYYADNNKAVKAALRSGEDSLRSARLRLENSIVSSYYSYLNASDSAATIAAVLKANEERYEESKIHYQAGQISFIDLENIEQSLVDSQLNQLNYLKSAKVAWIGVENLLGVGLGQ